MPGALLYYLWPVLDSLRSAYYIQVVCDNLDDKHVSPQYILPQVAMCGDSLMRSSPMQGRQLPLSLL